MTTYKTKGDLFLKIFRPKEPNMWITTNLTSIYTNSKQNVSMETALQRSTADQERVGLDEL